MRSCFTCPVDLGSALDGREPVRRISVKALVMCHCLKSVYYMLKRFKTIRRTTAASRQLVPRKSCSQRSTRICERGSNSPIRYYASMVLILNFSNCGLPYFLAPASYSRQCSSRRFNLLIYLKFIHFRETLARQRRGNKTE